MRDKLFCSLRLLSIVAVLFCSSGVSAQSANVDEVKSIARLYSAAFDRNALVEGLNFWINTFESGNSLESVAQQFYDSPEFNTRYGPLANTGYVEQLFRNVLGRDGQSGGIEFWVSHLDNGRSRAAVLISFADSPENITKTSVLYQNMRLEGGSWVFEGSPPQSPAYRACDNPLASLPGSCVHLSLVGSVGGGALSVSTLRNADNVLSTADSLLPEDLPELLGQVDLSGETALNQLLLVGVAGLSAVGLEPDALYLLRATGGQDFDPDSGLTFSAEPLAVQGSWHAIVSGQQLIDGNVEVSALTEALYRQVEPRIDEWNDAEIRSRLDAAAQLVVDDVDGSGEIDYLDVLRWIRGLDGEQYLGDLTDHDALADAVHFGQPVNMLVQQAKEVLGSHRLVMTFDAGVVKLETLNWEAPITVANFLAYVRAGFYDQMLVHRAINNFVIQIGRIDFLEREDNGNVRFVSKAPLFGSIVNESSNGVSNIRGTFAMARTSDPNSAAAEFFINQRNNISLDFGSANNPDGYAVFARALTGMLVVDEIAAERTATVSGIGSDVPQRGVVLESITFE